MVFSYLVYDLSHLLELILDIFGINVVYLIDIYVMTFQAGLDCIALSLAKLNIQSSVFYSYVRLVFHF